jgi:hypothetical protein
VKDYSKNSATGDYSSSAAPSQGTRYDSGAEEGTRGPNAFRREAVARDRRNGHR